MKIALKVLSGLVVLIVIVLVFRFLVGIQLQNKVSANWNAVQSEIRTTATDVSECRKIPAGYKACGGPDVYLIYSVSTTNEQELLRLVEQHYETDKKMTELKGLASTCNIEQEPKLIIEDNECVGVNAYPHYRTNENDEVEEYYERYRQ